MRKNIGNKVAIAFAIFFTLVSCGSSNEEPKRVLPIIGNHDVEYRMVDGKEVADTVYHKVPDFKYLNQDSTMVSSNDLKEKIKVVDFFFSHCPTICPPMTSQMKRLSEMTSDLDKNLHFLSFSIDPDRDKPTRLREYIKEHEIRAKNWEFLTGNEAATHELAKEFFNAANRDEESEGGFGHTEYFALVDTHGHVRGVYVGTDPKDIDKLEEDIRMLLEDEYGITATK